MKILIHSISFLSLLTGILIGLFASFGLGAVIFGPQILESPPPHTTSSFIFILITTPLFMVISSVGTLFTIILPLHLKFQVPLVKNDQLTRKLLNRYARKLEFFSRTPTS